MRYNTDKILILCSPKWVSSLGTRLLLSKLDSSSLAEIISHPVHSGLFLYVSTMSFVFCMKISISTGFFFFKALLIGSFFLEYHYIDIKNLIKCEIIISLDTPITLFLTIEINISHNNKNVCHWQTNEKTREVWHFHTERRRSRTSASPCTLFTLRFLHLRFDRALFSEN